MLETLERANLCVVPLDEERLWCRSMKSGCGAAR
jgi:hypothetical protein